MVKLVGKKETLHEQDQLFDPKYQIMLDQAAEKMKQGDLEKKRDQEIEAMDRMIAIEAGISNDPDQIEEALDDAIAKMKLKRTKPAKMKITPTFINQFISWVYGLDANDPLFRDQRNLINICKKEHNHAQIRHVLDLLSIYMELK